MYLHLFLCTFLHAYITGELVDENTIYVFPPWKGHVNEIGLWTKTTAQFPKNKAMQTNSAYTVTYVYVKKDVWTLVIFFYSGHC